MTTGDLRVFRGDANMARAADAFSGGAVGGGCDRKMAVPDIKIERRVNLGIVEFHQHIIAGDAELGSAEGDEGGDVKAAHSYQIKSRHARRKAELARARIVKGG